MGSTVRRDHLDDTKQGAQMSTETAEPLAVSIAEAARRLGVSSVTISRMIDGKQLKASRLVGRAGSRGRVVIQVSGLIKLLEANEV
jgi:excisionase family DNA binding protein